MKLATIGEIANTCDLRVYLVGGATRDMFRGQKSEANDFDFVITGDPSRITEFAEKLSRVFGSEESQFSQFQTFKIKAGTEEYEFAPARTETYAAPGALPDIITGPLVTLAEDLKRRDFGMNAFAFEVTKDGIGQMRDPLNTRSDISCKNVRVLHDKSFIDDPTRIFRAIRFAVRMNYEIEPQTMQLLVEALPYIDCLSGTRIFAEIKRIFVEDKSVEALMAMHRIGIMDAICHFRDGLMDGLSFASTKSEGARDKAFIAAFAYYASDPIQMAKRLLLPVRLERTAIDTKSAKSVASNLRLNSMPSEVYRNLRGLDETAIEIVGEITGGVLKVKFQEYLDYSRNVKVEINGNDLLKLGIPQGPKVGKILTSLVAAKIDGAVQNREQELAFVSQKLSLKTI